MNDRPIFYSHNHPWGLVNSKNEYRLLAYYMANNIVKHTYQMSHIIRKLYEL